MIVSVDPRLSLIQFERAIRSKFAAIKTKQIRELKNNTDIFIPPEDLIPRKCLIPFFNVNQAFQMPKKMP